MHLNTERSARFIIVDCDHDDFMRWRDAGLPTPRWTIVNGDLHPDPSKRGRHHHIWELTNPIVLGDSGRSGPQAFLRLVQLGIAHSIDGDPVFASTLGGGATKNPLHPAFNLIEWTGARPVTLSDLAAQADIELAIAAANANRRPGMQGRAIADQPEWSRHRNVFDRVRWDAYRAVWNDWDHYHTAPGAWSALEADIRRWLEAANDFPSPLPGYDLVATARSITRFCRHRLRPREPDVTRPNRGILRDAVDGLPLAERRAAGARHASAAKADRVRTAVMAAAEAMTAAGEQLSPGAVAARAKCDRKTARRHLAALTASGWGVRCASDDAEAVRPGLAPGREGRSTAPKNNPDVSGADALQEEERPPMAHTVPEAIPFKPNTIPFRPIARSKLFDLQADINADRHLERFRELMPSPKAHAGLHHSTGRPV